MKNTILRLALIAANFILVMTIILAVILIVLMITWNVNPDVLDNFRIVHDGSVFKFTFAPDKPGVQLSNYGSFFFHFVTVKALIITGILFMIIRIAIQVIRSISSLETFQSNNVQSFRKMGLLFLIWGALNILIVGESDGSLQIGFSLQFNYIIYALICYVLAEIFSEGNKLHEENQLTI